MDTGHVVGDSYWQVKEVEYHLGLSDCDLHLLSLVATSPFASVNPQSWVHCSLKGPSTISVNKWAAYGPPKIKEVIVGQAHVMAASLGYANVVNPAHKRNVTSPPYYIYMLLTYLIPINLPYYTVYGIQCHVHYLQ